MSKYRVMVVDDDPDIRFVTSGLLGDDFEMVQAESGLDALEKIERYEPDLVLLDVYMPIMDGFATCRSIRRQGQFSNVPVFFLTGASSESSREKAEKAGSQAFIEKPFDASRVVGSIRGFFTDHRTTPRLKTFTMRELKKIDETPLRVVEGEEQELPEPDQPIPGIPAATSEKSTTEEKKKRRRRVFGAARVIPPDQPPEEVTGGLTKELQLPAELQKEKETPVPEYPSLPKKRKDSVTPSETSGFSTVSGNQVKRRETEPDPPAAEPGKETISPPERKPAPAPAKPAKKTTPVARPHRPIPAAARSSKSAGSRPRVLCILADPSEMNAYTFALKGMAEFLPLRDPVEAVEIIARFQPDIVCVHIVAPEFSGLQLAQMLKSNPRLSHTEVVFLDTGRETPQQRAAAGRLSNNPTIRIPANADSLRKTIRQIATKAGFRIREKKLAYGVYVSEVLQSEREKAEAVRQQKEREFEKHRVSALGDFMDDLHKQVGEKEIPEALKPKTAQAYYLS